MSWMSALSKTYEACERAGLVGQIEEPILNKKGEPVFAPRPLTPTYHTVINTDVLVEITADGEFQSARELAKGENKAIIPSTNAAEGRTGVHAHRTTYPVSDKLKVMDIDESYLPECEERHRNCFMRNLSDMLESPIFQAAPMREKEGVLAVQAYLLKGTLLADMMQAFPDKFLHMQELKPYEQYEAEWREKKVKIKKGEDPDRPLTPKEYDTCRCAYAKELYQWNPMIRFAVNGMREQQGPADLYKNPAFAPLYIRYMREQEKSLPQGFCYGTGEQGALVRVGPKNVFSTEANAKLLRGYDAQAPATGMFSVFGNAFDNAGECAAICSIPTQNAMAMLRWLMDHQGWRPLKNSAYTVVVWDKECPQDTVDPNDLFGNRFRNWSPVSEEADAEQDVDPEEEDEEEEAAAYPGGKRAKNLVRMYQGYTIKGISEQTNSMAVAIFDVISSGRASVLYFNEFSADMLLENATHWYNTSGWGVPTNTGYRYFSPSIHRVFQTCYGDNYEDTLREQAKAIANGLVRCLIQRAPLSYTIMDSAFRRHVHTERWRKAGSGSTKNADIMRDYESTLHTTAGLIRKYYYDKEGLSLMPVLDEENNNRDYLYGRALAYYDNLERWGLYYSGAEGNTRPTNAWKLMPDYFSRPGITLLRLQNKINPYIQKVWEKSAKQTSELNAILRRISELETEGTVNDPLGPMGLLGYAAQMDEFAERRRAARNERSSADNKKEDA